ncbi:MAG: FKBP-type peptidyl-prolyl cis-trans isomerase [Alphaproteobacteria bacterium]
MMRPFPRWLSWLFVVFLAYIVYVGNTGPKPPATAPDTPQEATIATTDTTTEYPALRQLFDKNRWQRAINPAFVGEANIREVTLGSGDLAAQCGSPVTVLLRGTTRDGASFDAGHDESKPLSFILGNAPFPALNEGIIGMRAGGVRQIYAPASQVYASPQKNADEEIMFRLELVAVTAPVEADFPAMAVTLVSGSDRGEPSYCGREMTARISVFDDSGTRLYLSAEPLTFTPGQAELAAGVDLLARGMRLGETRMLYLPPAWLGQSKTASGSLTPLRQILAQKTWVALLLERQE